MMTTPTITKMVKVYVEAAAVERLKCGRPNEGTVRNTLAGVRAFRRWLNARRERLGHAYIGFDEDFPLVSIIKPQLIHNYIADLLGNKVKPVTAMSYITQFQQLFARWVRPYYEDRGWKVPPFPSFGKRPIAPRYSRPSKEQLRKVKMWYESIWEEGRGKREEGRGKREEGRGKGEEGRGMVFPSRRGFVSARELWFVATMMLEFGMRNGDIMRLTRENFVEYEGCIYLNYMPHKTRHSSGRMVKWPVHRKIWDRLTEERGDLHLPALGEDVFDALNRQMRGLGFTGTKGAYELRKICVDHIYQKYGAEMATSISGDDIKTIIRYYADPAQPNVGAVRVVDLL